MNKKILFLSIFFIALIGLTGCTTKEKTFKKADFKITLTDNFKEDEYKGKDYYFISQKAGLTVLEESFEDLEQIKLNSDSTLDEYAKAVLKANNKDIEVIKEDNFYYFTFDSMVNDVKYYYMSVLLKGKDGFWLVNFFGKNKDRMELEPQFLKYAKSIEV